MGGGGGELPGWTILDVQLPGTWGKQIMGGGREEGPLETRGQTGQVGVERGGGREENRKQGHICSMNKEEGKVHV